MHTEFRTCGRALLFYNAKGLGDGVRAVQDGEPAVWLGEECQLHGNGMNQLLGAMETSETFTHLGIQNIRLQSSGVRLLADYLQRSGTLATLHLESAEISDDHIELLATSLKNNQVLSSLDLRGNRITFRGAEHLADMLKFNRALKAINLNGNRIADIGALALCEGFKFNSTLEMIQVERNDISPAEYRAFFKVFQGDRPLLTTGSDHTRGATLDKPVIQATEGAKVSTAQTSAPPNSSRLPRRVPGVTSSKETDGERLSGDNRFNKVADMYAAFLKLSFRLQSQRELRTKSVQNLGQTPWRVWDRLVASVEWFHSDASETLSFEDLSDFLRRGAGAEERMREFEELQQVIGARASPTLCLERDKTRERLVKCIEDVLGFEQGVNLHTYRQIVNTWAKRCPDEFKPTASVSRCGSDHSIAQAFKETKAAVKTAFQEIEDWRRRHDLEYLRTESEQRLATFMERLAYEPKTALMDVSQLAKLEPELSLLVSALETESHALDKDTSFEDRPSKMVNDALSKVGMLVYGLLPQVLQEAENMKTALLSKAHFYGSGQEKPKLDQLRGQLQKLHELEYKKSCLEAELQNQKRQFEFEEDPCIGEQVQVLKKQIQACDLHPTLKRVFQERSRVILFAKKHYPELFHDKAWYKKLGLQHLCPGLDALYTSGVYMEGLTENNFETVRELSSSDSKTVKLVKFDGKEWVLKKFSLQSDKSRRTFLLQSDILLSLRNANIVRVEGVFFDISRDAGYLLLPFYSGGDLMRWLAENPAEARSVVFCKQVLSDILNGLQAIHSKGHVHCDLKPSNIFLTQSFRAVIGDFDGLKLENKALTSSIQVTPGYVAPEVYHRTTTSVYPSIDMYSFGKIMREVFPRIPADGESLIAQLCSADPKKRPSAAQVLQSTFLSSTPGQVRDCIICFDKFQHSETVACPADHACCKKCLNNFVASDIGLSRISPQVDVPCSANCGEFLSAQTVMQFVEKSTWEKALKHAADIQEARLQREFDERLRREREKTMNDFAAQKHRDHIIDTILTLHCPQCKKAFFDFTGCFALQCRDEHGNGCKTFFCAWCLKNCGMASDAAHRHVAQCGRGRQSRAVFYGDLNAQQEAMKRHRSSMLQEYWNSFVSRESPEVQRSVKEALQGFHDIVDLQILR